MSERVWGRGDCGELDSALRREWLVTNGLGGFACATVAGIHTRRYHGLLMAALNPPLGRTLLVSKLEPTAHYAGETYLLACNEYRDGTVHPHGYRHLERFWREGSIPVWRFALADAWLERRVWMRHGRNTTFVRYTLSRASASLTLELEPLCTCRDYHHHGQQQHEDGEPRVETVPRGCEIHFREGAPAYRLLSDQADFQPDPDWHWQFRHRLEDERGMDAAEDLFRPGRFRAELQPGQSLTVVLSAERRPARDGGTALRKERERQQVLLRRAGRPTEPWRRQLVLAADQFLVARQGEVAGTTVIAGYPWFGDWGRDTMISLTGLTLATGRHREAADVLRTFAAHRYKGLLPNRFPDQGQIPDYNTVDATLWWFHAVHAYWQATQDRATVAALYPALADSLHWHHEGTLHGIRVDPVDGLLEASDPGVQLTWMDAKVGDRVFTPRAGKPVEVNALWINALRVMESLAGALDEDPLPYRMAAERATGNFGRRFWNPDTGYLFDVVDGPDGDDASLRPNQILAVALPCEILDEPRRRAVVEVCARRLLTSYGLRSLAADHADYHPGYRGGVVERDGAYHQGTVWSWLLGPFALAHYRVYGDAVLARSFLEPLRDHLDDACLGTVSEIFDAEPPHRPRGAFAQAWGVAMWLEAWWALG